MSINELKDAAQVFAAIGAGLWTIRQYLRARLAEQSEAERLSEHRHTRSETRLDALEERVFQRGTP